MISVIDSNQNLSHCVTRACAGYEVREFRDVMSAMQVIDEGVIPDLIFLEILLTGPDAFSFLDELVSYPDTAHIPVVIVSALNLRGQDFSAYGVVGVLNKETMLPQEVRSYAKKYAK